MYQNRKAKTGIKTDLSAAYHCLYLCKADEGAWRGLRGKWSQETDRAVKVREHLTALSGGNELVGMGWLDSTQSGRPGRPYSSRDVSREGLGLCNKVPPLRRLTRNSGSILTRIRPGVVAESGKSK